MTDGKRVLLLWDVDHTLIENSGVSKAVYARAFEALTGRMARVQPGTDGRTDYEIMRNLYAANGVALVPEHERSWPSALVESMDALSARLMADGYALPGVLKALTAIDAIPSIVQSVLTGNIRANAEAKLRLLGSYASLLDLDVGGYGSDDIVRSRLVGVAQDKAAKKYRHRFERTSTVLVGDTERDVAAALDGGAMIIGVATGVTSEEELRQAGAHIVVPSLVDVSLLLDALRELTGQALEAAV